MKTAISIPDTVFATADRLAKRLGVSRSALYTQAVAEFVAKHTDTNVTARLNALYVSEPSRLEPTARRAQGRAIRDAEW